VSDVLRTLPQREAFYFFEDIGKYTGKFASSLAEFCEMIRTVDKRSIAFHFERHDFENWIKQTLRDIQLANAIGSIKKTRSGERLRNKIYKISKKRLEELNSELPQKCN